MKLLFDNLNNIIELFNSNYSYNDIINKLKLNINELKLKRWIKRYIHLYKLNIDSREDIKKYLEQYYIVNNRFNMNGLKNNLYIINKIELLSLSKYNLTIQEKIHYILFDKDDNSTLCKNCKKNRTKFVSITLGYRNYCSNRCSNNSIETKTKYINTMLNKYGVDNSFKAKEVKKKIKHSMIDKYGTDNLFKSKKYQEQFRKIKLTKYGSLTNIDKVQQTKKEKYGDPNYNNIDKIEKTKLKKYNDPNFNNRKKYKKTVQKKFGVDHPWKSNDIKQQIRFTMKKIYGVEYPLQNSEIKNRYKKTMLDKYGVDSIFKLKNYHDMTNKIKLEKYGSINNIEKIRKTNLEKYGVQYVFQKHINHYNEWIDNDKFIHIYNKLESVEDIANYFNVTLSAIHKRSRKFNLPYKPHRKEVTIKKIGQIIESYGYEVEYNNRSIIKPLEIDIIIRRDGKIVKCLEYNGIMFHSLGISQHSPFNNWYRYRDNIESFIDKDRIKLKQCKDLDIELFILREDLYLNDNSIIDRWLNNQLKYKILDKPVVYRFKTMNNSETISIEEMESSIISGYRVYFDWIEIL